MSPLAVGVLLVFVVLIAMFFQIALHPFIKKLTNSYLFWLFIAIICLVYFIIFRYVPDFKALITVVSAQGDSEKLREIVTHYYPQMIASGEFTRASSIYLGFCLSKIFITDFCPFFFVASLLALILQPSRKIASYLAGPQLLGALLTLFVSIFPGDDGNAQLNFQYVFMGNDPYRLKYSMHALSACIALGVLLNTPNVKMKNWFYTGVVCIVFFLYITIMKYASSLMKIENESFAISGIVVECTGIVENDWLKEILPAIQGAADPKQINAVFSGFGSVLGDIPWYFKEVITILLLTLIASGIVWLNWTVQLLRPYKIPNVKAKRPFWVGYYKV